MKNELTSHQTPAISLDFTDPKLVETLKKTVALGATDEEFLMFSEICKATGLNPFKKEIWFIKAGGRPQIMTGITGYFTVANRHPMFDGLEIEVETNDDGFPVKAVAKAHRKDRKFPAVGVALMREYRKNTATWAQMPTVMLAKVAKSIALREAFPQELNGTYTAEEMPPEFSVEQAQKAPEGQGNGTIYEYDTHLLQSLDDEKKTALKRALKRYRVTTAPGGNIVCHEPIPELEAFLIPTIEVQPEVDHA